MTRNEDGERLEEWLCVWNLVELDIELGGGVEEALLLGLVLVVDGLQLELELLLMGLERGDLTPQLLEARLRDHAALIGHAELVEDVEHEAMVARESLRARVPNAQRVVDGVVLGWLDGRAADQTTDAADAAVY